ncbi:endonuclease domain-containing protein [Streptomyces glomeratus]|uniref:endonuclease domain-containing protein n=1 Tax=Streptomyces glomeratus TaxID=284452 RepID=UPI0027E304E8|nr:endonuclease domain-containing protein [Streptomyces glomeratus]
MKRCGRCGEFKPHAAFAVGRAAPDGLRHHCRACGAESDLRRRRTHGQDGSAAWSCAARPQEHGLTEAEHDQPIASRGGACRVRPVTPATQVDHCHETGRVRGVLCFNCNSGLGLLGDAPEAIYRAADYLEGNAWKPTLVAPGVYRPPS